MLQNEYLVANIGFDDVENGQKKKSVVVQQQREGLAVANLSLVGVSRRHICDDVIESFGICFLIATYPQDKEATKKSMNTFRSHGS